MRYLVTGGGGFIGSHLCEHLLDCGHQVVALDDFSTGRPGNVEHLRGDNAFRLVVGDVTDTPLLASAMEGCDGVFHLAAAVGVKLIMERPVETLTTNVRGAEVVLDVADREGTRLLLASTSEVYGKSMDGADPAASLHEQADRTLGATTRRRWAYACSKAFDEFLALAYGEERDLEVVVARYFNTVGPRQTGRYGMVVPRFVERALEGRPIEVHGDGEQTRSFAHVDDVVRATVGLMEHPNTAGDVYNVGNDEPITIGDLARRVKELTGSDSPIEYLPHKEVYGEGFEDIRHRTPDIGKLRRSLGYKPQHGVDDILADVIAWFRTGKGAGKGSPP